MGIGIRFITFSFVYFLVISAFATKSPNYYCDRALSQWYSSQPRLPINEIGYQDLSNKEDLGILVFGDTAGNDQFPHAGKYQRKLARAIKRWLREQPMDLVLRMGDNFYEPARKNRPNKIPELDEKVFEQREHQVYSFMDEFNLPNWIAVGNHDDDERRWKNGLASQILHTQQDNYWKLPATHYGVPGLPDWLGIYFLHSTPLAKSRTSAIEYVEEQLKSANEYFKNKTGIKILVSHHPLVRPNLKEASIPLSKNYFKEIELLQTFMMQEGVRLILSGHVHGQSHLSSANFEQIIQGAGGGDTFKLEKNYTPSANPTISEEVASTHVHTNMYGFAVLRISKSQGIHVEFYKLKDKEKSKSLSLFYEVYFSLQELVAPGT
ncbi:MAG: metallophosphoesterase [Bdellovibrionaceae bacterium]|nr:metallophosphoesterase [Pseudobdellovibrionaceae bacterium]